MIKVSSKDSFQDDDFQTAHFDLEPRNDSRTLILKYLTKDPEMKSEIITLILNHRIC